MLKGGRFTRDQSVALLVWVALFAVYVAVSAGVVKSYDGKTMVNLATRLLTKHTLTTDPATDSLHLQSPYVSYGFGATVLALPFDAIQRAINDRSQTILTLANPVVLASCGSLLYLIGRRLGWRRWVAIATALGFGVLTTALWQSTELFSEPGVAFGALLIVLAILMWTEQPLRASILAGAGVAIAMLFRPDSALLIAPLALAVFFVASPRDVLSGRTLLGFATPVAIIVAFELWYDQHRYGSIFETGFKQQARGGGFDTPLFHGLNLLLRSPGRGFFWSSPILLLAIPGFVVLYRRHRALTVAIASVVVARLIWYAKWRDPGGGAGWGPRLLFPITALLAIVAGAFIESVCEWRSARHRRVAWFGIGGLALISAFVSFLSIIIGYGEWTNEYLAPNLSKAEYLRRLNLFYFSFSHSQLRGNLHLLRTGHEIEPIHFRNGADAIGLVALVVAVSAATLAFVVGNRTKATTTTAPPQADLSLAPASDSLHAVDR